MKRIFLLLSFLLLLEAPSFGATVGSTSTVGWTLSTTYTDSTTLTPASVKLYLGAATGVYTKTFVVLPGSTGIVPSGIALLSAFPGLADGNYFITATELDSYGAESAYSNEVAFTLSTKKPMPPINLLIGK